MAIVQVIRTNPQLLMFGEKLVILLSSDFKPRLWGGELATPPVEIVNNFTAQYPVWQATTTYLEGDFVQPTASNGHFYRAVQGGTSGTAEPTFPLGERARVTDKNIIWAEAGTSTSPAPPGGAHGIIHAGSLWLWGTSPLNTTDGLDGPSALRMSNLGNPNAWNPLNSAFVDKDDGQRAAGLSTFTISETGIAPIGSLILFKDFATYQVVGVFGSPNFAIQRIQTDMGNSAPRSVQFLPGFGIARLTHLGVGLLDGTRDRVISEEIRPYLFGGRADITALDWSFVYLARGAQVSTPPLYVLAIPTLGSNGALNRLLIYDLVLKAWSVVDPPFNVSHLVQIRGTGAFPTTVFGGHSTGSLESWQGGEVRGWQTWADDANPAKITNGTQVKWSVRTPDVFVEPSQRVYIRQLLIRGINVNSSTITAKVIVHGNDGSPSTLPVKNFSLGVSGQFELKVDVNRTVLNAYAEISGQGIVELEAASWSVHPKPEHVPISAH